MELKKLLRPDHVVAPLASTDLAGAVGELIGALRDSGDVADPEALERTVAESGLKDVVSVGEHVALPHFRTDAVERLVVALGVAESALEGEVGGSRIAPRAVVLILAPRDASAFYLQTVAALARIFRDDALVQRLIAARSREDVLRLEPLMGLRIQPRLAVREIMSHDLASVGPDAPLRSVVDMIMARGVRAVPVVGEKGEVLGIVTDGDLMRALLPQIPKAGEEAGDGERGPSPETLKVRDVMSRSVLCISEDLGVTEVATMMINKDVQQLPVVSEGRLVGMLTRGDILRRLFSR